MWGRELYRHEHEVCEKVVLYCIGFTVYTIYTMEDKNIEKAIDKALDIYAALISGRSVSSSDAETKTLYNDYYSNSSVYEITGLLMKKLNLKLYEYGEALYVTAGEGNKVFGYTNDDLKRILGLRLNKELYLCYFIMYCSILFFYPDSAAYQTRDHIRLEELIERVDTSLAPMKGELITLTMSEVEEESFKTIALLWDELPVSTVGEGEKTKASRASKTGYVKLVMNFMSAEGLFVTVADRFYPTDRLKCLAENYFEDEKSRIYNILADEV